MRDNFTLDISLPTWEQNDKDGNTVLELTSQTDEDQEIVLWMVDGGPYAATKNELTAERYEKIQKDASKHDGYYMKEMTVAEFTQAIVDLMDIDLEVVPDTE